jgi:uncharacterized membrane protein
MGARSMNLKRICHDERGATLVEAAITMPLFLSLTFGVLQAGLLLWTQAGLQHGVDMAARCATVNDAAVKAGASTSLCFPGTAPGSVTKATIQNYAAQIPGALIRPLRSLLSKPIRMMPGNAAALTAIR